MSIVWPGEPDLPDYPLMMNTSGTGKDLVQRSGMGVGEEKVRQRLTDGPEDWPVGIAVDEVGRKAFKAFFDVDIAGGASEFDWYSPDNLNHSGSAVACRIKGRPRYVPHGRPGRWIILFTLEVLP